MTRFMTHLTASFALICGVLFVYGFIAGERISLSRRDDRREFIVVISAADADERYRHLFVEGCAAEITDSGMGCIAQGWYGNSSRAWAGRQQPVPFPDAPRGVPLLFYAVIADRSGRTLVSSTYLTSRRLR
jgi:hypothetical protein